MKLAAAYIRVSTEDQIEFSPDSQLKQIRDYARRNDLLLPDHYVFIDEGISGKDTKKRDAFNKMIGIAKTKPTPFDTILVWKFSRFARNREDSIVYKSMLRKQCGIQVISISESIGDDKMSILIEAMIEAMDEYYSINLAEEVRRGMTEKASRGGVVSSPPYGYTIENKIYVPDENADTVRYIFSDFLAGMSCREIAAKYGAFGVRTTRGNMPDNRFVEYILRNPAYTGKIRWCTAGRGASKRDFNNPNTLIVDGEHEPLISEEIYKQAQDKLAEIKNMYGRHQRQNQPVNYMLKGLIRCSNCHATLVLQSTKCPSLQCHSYARGACKVSHSLSVAKANETVIRALQSSVATCEFQIQPHKTETVLTDTTKLIEKEKVKLKRAKLAYTEGIDTLEEYRQNKAEIQKKIDDLTAALPKEHSFHAETYTSRVKQIIELITDPCSSEEIKNKALRSIIDYIIYDKTNQSLVLHYYV